MTNETAGHYDIVVLGAGGGGIAAGLEARRNGAIVALLDKAQIGGSHTHFGTVPSKALLNVEASFEFPRAMEHVQAMVDRVRSEQRPERFHGAGVDTCLDPGGASFLDPHTVTIGEYLITADSFVISTGSLPKMLPTAGDQPVPFLHSENFWGLRDLPKTMTFVGGGMIAAELGQALSRFGTKVTIIEREERILTAVDSDVADALTSRFAEQGIEIITNTEVTSCSMADDGTIRLDIDGHEASSLSADQLFLSMGRVPNVEGLGLDKAGVEYSEHGIPVNNALQTSAPHITAIGDVASTAKFSHVARVHGERVVRNALSGTSTPVLLDSTSWALHTDPAIAHLAMTEAEAREVHGDGVQVTRIEVAADRLPTGSDVDGFLKVIMSPDDIVVGATGVGSDACEWVQMLTVAIRQQLTATDVADMVSAHP